MRVCVQLVAGTLALRRTQRLLDAYLVLLLFPLSLVFVGLLEKYGGLN